MTSIKELETEFDNYRESWSELRPILVQQLPNDKNRINKADRLFKDMFRYLEKATRADMNDQKVRLLWWYSLTRAAMRDHFKLVDELGERGLKAQAEAKRLRKEVVSQNSG